MDHSASPSRIEVVFVVADLSMQGSESESSARVKTQADNPNGSNGKHAENSQRIFRHTRSAEEVPRSGQQQFAAEASTECRTISSGDHASACGSGDRRNRVRWLTHASATQSPESPASLGCTRGPRLLPGNRSPPLRRNRQAIRHHGRPSATRSITREKPGGAALVGIDVRGIHFLFLYSLFLRADHWDC